MIWFWVVNEEVASQGTRLTRDGNSVLRLDRAKRARLAIVHVDLLIVISAERKSQVEERSRREVHVRVSSVTHVYFDMSETTRTSKSTGD